MIKEINKDITQAFDEGNINILLHQVNCQGVMGAGLAKQIKQEYPSHYQDYLNSEMHLGNVVFSNYSNTTHHRYIVGVFGQNHYGKGKQTNYVALTMGLAHVFKIAQIQNLSVGIPKYIGCGLAGGDWSVVYPMIYDAHVMYGVETRIYFL